MQFRCLMISTGGTPWMERGHSRIFLLTWSQGFQALFAYTVLVGSCYWSVNFFGGKLCGAAGPHAIVFSGTSLFAGPTSDLCQLLLRDLCRPPCCPAESSPSAVAPSGGVLPFTMSATEVPSPSGTLWMLLWRRRPR